MSTASIGAHSRPVTSRWTPARHAFAAWRRKTRLAAKRAPIHVIGSQATARRLILTAAGLGFVDAGAYAVSLIAGLLATGISLLMFNECMN